MIARHCILELRYKENDFMKKLVILIYLILMGAIMVSCGSSKNNVVETTPEKNDDKAIDPKAYVMDDFVGEGGYIIIDQVYDYSGLCVDIYEYGDAKLPIAPITGAIIQHDENGYIYFSDVEKEELEVYMDEVKKILLFRKCMMIY